MTPTLMHGWHNRPALTATAEYMCSPHTRFTVADPAGPLHLHDGAVCWAPQVEMGGRVRQPESIAAQAARAGDDGEVCPECMTKMLRGQP